MQKKPWAFLSALRERRKENVIQGTRRTADEDRARKFQRHLGARERQDNQTAGIAARRRLRLPSRSRRPLPRRNGLASRGARGVWKLRNRKRRLRARTQASRPRT